MTTYGMGGARMTQYAQRISEQQREIELLKADAKAAAVREAELRRALASIKNELGVPVAGYPAPVANAYELAQAALANPSPLAEAAGAVLEWIAEAERQEAALPTGLWELFNAYRALRDGRDADGGEA